MNRLCTALAVPFGAVAGLGVLLNILISISGIGLVLYGVYNGTMSLGGFFAWVAVLVVINLVIAFFTFVSGLIAAALVGAFETQET